MKTQQTAPSQMPLGNASPLPPDDDRPPLPEGWVWTTIGDAYEVILGQSPPSSTYNTEGIGLPFYQGKAEFGNIFPVPVKWCSQPNKIAEAGDVLISVRAPVGPTNLCRERSCIGRGLSAIRPRDEMPNLYLFYYLRCIEQDWESKATGTTFSAINGKVLREQEIPLAPLPEQHRIVAAIETQFTRLDAAVAALERAQANLARYKASVLKAACEGRLVPTEAALYHPRCDCWGEATPQASTNAKMCGDAETPDREEPGGGCLAPTDAVAGADAAYEPADVLLRRILAERRARWMADNPGKRYIEPAAPDTSGPALSNAEGLPDLPEGWVWASLPQLGELARGKSKHRPRNAPHLYGGPYPFIQTGEIRRAEGIITGYSKTYSEAGLAQSRLWPKGTLCITIAANIAETAILGFDACFPDSVVGFVAEQDVNVRFVEYFIRTIREDLERYAPATAQKNINLETLQNVGVALPPLAEQHRIVAEVERRLSVVAEVEASIDANLARAARLRQAILREAFAGRLVPCGDGDVGVGA